MPACLALSANQFMHRGNLLNQVCQVVQLLDIRGGQNYPSDECDWLRQKTVVAFQKRFHWSTYLIFCLG